MIIFILILAFVLRLINLSQSLWLDEAVQVITAQNSFAYIFQEITGDFHPPLYYFLMHFWVRIFGSSEIALRMPSVLFGAGTVLVLYKLTVRAHSRFVAVLAAVFLATAPFHIYYSQEARMYSMVTFFASLSMFYFVNISNIKSQISKPISKIKNLNIEYIFYFISTVCLIYSDYYGLLVLLAQMIFLLIQKKYKYLLICLFVYLLIYVPWIPMFVKQIQTGMQATQMLPGWAKLVNTSFVKALPLTFVKFSIGRITIFNKSLYAGIIFIVGLIYGSLFLRTIKGWLRDKLEDGKGEKLLITLWFFVPLIVSWAVSLFIPNFQPFRLLLILPSFYLILAMGILNFNTKKILISVILFINLISLNVYYFNPYFHREDWKGLVKYLTAQKESIVILPSSASNWPIRYYDPEGKIKLQEGIAGVGEIRGIREIGEDKVYFIRYLAPLFDPNEMILANLHSQGYTKTREISFNQIPLWEFSK